MRFIIVFAFLVVSIFVFWFGYRLGVRKKIYNPEVVGGIYVGVLFNAVLCGLFYILVKLLLYLDWYPD